MRVLATVLVLLTQLFAVLAPGCVVTCIHEDGVEAVELVGSECCRIAREASRDVDVGDRGAHGPAVHASGDTCRDAPLNPEQTVVARSTARSEHSEAQRAAPLTVVLWTAAPQIAALPSEYVGVHGPPPGAVPRPRRLLVLRC